MLQVLELFNRRKYWVLNPHFVFLLTVFIWSYSLPIMASEEKSNVGNKLEKLQTDITQNDLKIIEQLVTIAESKSSQVLEAKIAMGWRAFQDVVSIELSPSLTTTNYNSPDDPDERESSFYLNIAIDPIKLISAFERKPILKSRWQEAKQQKRLSVIQHYLVYIQARQATKIAAYRIASLNSSQISVEKVKNLSNPEYVTAATQMLNTKAQEQIVLEELAACVGLSTPEIITILKGK